MLFLFRWCEKTTKIWPSFPISFFDIVQNFLLSEWALVPSNYKWKMGQSFVTFLEYLNFKCLKNGTNKHKGAYFIYRWSVLFLKKSRRDSPFFFVKKNKRKEISYNQGTVKTNGYNNIIKSQTISNQNKKTLIETLLKIFTNERFFSLGFIKINKSIQSNFRMFQHSVLEWI